MAGNFTMNTGFDNFLINTLKRNYCGIEDYLTEIVNFSRKQPYKVISTDIVEIVHSRADAMRVHIETVAELA